MPVDGIEEAEPEMKCFETGDEFKPKPSESRTKFMKCPRYQYDYSQFYSSDRLIMIQSV